MSLPTGFATPAQAVAPQPLHVVARDSFAAWRDAQPPAVQAWLAVHRFDGAAGTALAWADAQGQLAGAVIGIGDALDPHAYAHAPTAAPAWSPCPCCWPR